MNNKDALYNEYYQIEDDMKGISPKLSIYKEMEKRLNILKERINVIRNTKKLVKTKKTKV